MKYLTHPLIMISFMVGGFLLVIQTVHTKAHLEQEKDVHGYVKQFCRKNRDTCKSMLSE